MSKLPQYNNFTLKMLAGGIALFCANRPKVKNAMNRESWGEFEEFLLWANAEKEVRAIIISGEGEGAFIAGADIKEFMHEPPKGALFSRSSNMVRLLATGTKPVVAAVNGAAFGGGFEVAMGCDIRVVAEGAMLGLPEATLGLLPGMGGTQRLCKIIGAGRAKEVIMAGRVIKGPQAVEWGLAYSCVPAEKVVDEAVRVCEKMLQRGPTALALIKRFIDLAYATSDETGLMIENLGFSALMGSDEMLEGTTAFVEKRPPDFLNLG